MNSKQKINYANLCFRNPDIKRFESQNSNFLTERLNYNYYFNAKIIGYTYDTFHNAIYAATHKSRLLLMVNYNYLPKTAKYIHFEWYHDIPIGKKN